MYYLSDYMCNKSFGFTVWITNFAGAHRCSEQSSLGDNSLLADGGWVRSKVKAHWGLAWQNKHKLTFTANYQPLVSVSVCAEVLNINHQMFLQIVTTKIKQALPCSCGMFEH